MRLKPGDYEGKIKDYGISSTKAGKKQAFIIFDVVHPEDGGTSSLTWYGLLDPKPSAPDKKAPAEFTVATLLDCGFSCETIEAMAAGKDSNALEIGKAMSLSIEDNEWNGTISSRIAWVNVPGKSLGPKRISYEDAHGQDSGALRAILMKNRKEKAGGTPVPSSPL